MIKIDAGLKALIPALTKEEYEQLEKNILDEGIREPILLWYRMLCFYLLYINLYKYNNKVVGVGYLGTT